MKRLAIRSLLLLLLLLLLFFFLSFLSCFTHSFSLLLLLLLLLLLVLLLLLLPNSLDHTTTTVTGDLHSTFISPFSLLFPSPPSPPLPFLLSSPYLQITIELHRQELSRHKERVKELQAEISVTDQHICARFPQLNLDTLEDRYEKRRKAVRLVYDQNDITAADLCSHGVYKGLTRLQQVDDGSKQTGRKTRSGAQKQVTRSLKPSRMNKKKLATHTVDQCSLCQKKFSSRSALQRHLLTHTGEKPFKCETCQRDFSQRGHLRKHMLTHTGEKPHQCTICLKSFNRLGNLRRHSLIHSGEKIHECHYCHKKFVRHGDLRPHLLTHTGEKPFPCTHCSKSFNRRGNLLRHINACHNKDKQSK